MDNPKYVITTRLACPEGAGVTAVAYYFFARSQEAYAARRQMILGGQKPKFQTYDPLLHAAVWKDSQIPVIEVVDGGKPAWRL